MPKIDFSVTVTRTFIGQIEVEESDLENALTQMEQSPRDALDTIPQSKLMEVSTDEAEFHSVSRDGQSLNW